MGKETKHSQIVVRITGALERKIKKEADKFGLTKAAWVRQTLIKFLSGSGDGNHG